MACCETWPRSRLATVSASARAISTFTRPIYVYALDDATGLARDPLFVKDTLSNPKAPASQGAGPIHVHRNGKFVYLTNRTFPVAPGGAREISDDGENNVVVYAIDQNSGEPKPIQHIDGRGVQRRLSFVRKYDVEVGAFQQFWSGMLALI